MRKPSRTHGNEPDWRPAYMYGVDERKLSDYAFLREAYSRIPWAVPDLRIM